MERISNLVQTLKQLTPNVYYQPTDKTIMKYPAIVINDEYSMTENANNKLYRFNPVYELIYISRDPIDTIKVLNLFPMIRHTNSSVMNELNHAYFRLFL